MTFSLAPSARRRGVRAAALASAAFALAACAAGFEAAKYTNPVSLYRASNDRLQRRKWDDALAGFDRLATQLPARDTLLPRVYFSQGRARASKGEHLLAAQAFARIQDAFPDDSLAPEALFEEGREYEKLWDNPARDPQYGQTALATFRQLVQLYPDAPRVPDATKHVAAINQMFAAKDLETGMHYMRRKAYDPALIYFKDVVRLYPGTPAAHGAYLRMVQAYKVINYKEEIAEACTEMRKTYPRDGEVQQACGTGAGAGGSAAPTTASAAGADKAVEKPAAPKSSSAASPAAPAPPPIGQPSPAVGSAGRP